MSRIVYVNGDYLPEEEAKISVFDRGFLFADGVYEVTSVLDGRLVDFAGHLARLHRSLDALEIPSPVADEALRLRDAARAAGFGVMVGCMVGSSLAMAPAVLVAQGAAVTDLDGPLLLARDRAAPLVYDEAGVHPPTPELWG